MDLNEIRNELSDIVGTSVFLPDHAEDQYWRLIQKISDIVDSIDYDASRTALEGH